MKKYEKPIISVFSLEESVGTMFSASVESKDNDIDDMEDWGIKNI